MKQPFLSKRLVLAALGALLSAAVLLAHEGHQHQAVLGTVERVRDCHFVVKTQKGETKTIFLAPTTRYERGAQAGTKQDLKPGTRVSVAVENDEETASTIRIGGAR